MRWSAPKKPSVKVGPRMTSAPFSGGPLDGKRIVQRDVGDNSTLTFPLNGRTGRYEKLEWRGT